MSNTKRVITFKIEVEADDHDSTSLSDVVEEFIEGEIVSTLASEGWSTLEIVSKIETPKDQGDFSEEARRQSRPDDIT